MRTYCRELLVTGAGAPPLGVLEFEGFRLNCVLGRSGIIADKKEGDGATPAGRWPLRRVLYRPDRLAPPETYLPVQPVGRSDGWCDDPADRLYNRPVRLPYPASAESMWRRDRLYDIVVVLGHNDDPVVPGRGSAIFMHLAAPDRRATEGCIALSLPDMMSLLRSCGPGTLVCIKP